VTDEAGFSFAQEVQGLGIKIGPGATAASRRVPSAAEFREILRSTARSLLDAS
jgi:trehalose-6-phosphatase